MNIPTPSLLLPLLFPLLIPSNLSFITILFIGCWGQILHQENAVETVCDSLGLVSVSFVLLFLPLL